MEKGEINNNNSSLDISKFEKIAIEVQKKVYELVQSEYDNFNINIFNKNKFLGEEILYKNFIDLILKNYAEFNIDDESKGYINYFYQNEINENTVFFIWEINWKIMFTLYIEHLWWNNIHSGWFHWLEEYKWKFPYLKVIKLMLKIYNSYNIKINIYKKINWIKRDDYERLAYFYEKSGFKKWALQTIIYKALKIESRELNKKLDGIPQ